MEIVVCILGNSTTTLNANVETHIALNTLSHNTNTALFTISGGVIRVNKPGIYLIIGYIRINSGTVGSRVNTHIWKNATAWSPVSGGTQYILRFYGTSCVTTIRKYSANRSRQ